MKAIKFQGAALAAMLIAGSALAADQGVTDTEILLGEVEPLTGPPALLGVAHNIGVRLALEEANANGGIAGRKLRLIAEDDGYVTARTIQAIKKLTSVDKVFALTSLSGSGQALAAMPVIEQIGIPTMSPIGTVPALYDPAKENLFVVGQTYVEGMHQLALFLADKFPGKKWGVVLQDDDYGLQLQEGIDLARKEKNIDIVYEAKYKRGQKDFSSEMLGVKDAGVEVFIAGGIISENIAMIKEMEKLGIDPETAIFWPGRVAPVLKLMGPASDGIYAVDYVVPMASDEGKAFVEMATKYVSADEVKQINRYTLTGYASTRALLEAMKRCADDLTWACTNAELAKTKDLETGVMGPVTFDGSRFSNQPVQIMQADFGNLTFKPVQ